MHCLAITSQFSATAQEVGPVEHKQVDVEWIAAVLHMTHAHLLPVQDLHAISYLNNIDWQCTCAGDLARWQENGTIQVMGRIDRQVLSLTLCN